jgi:hypothetical protein
MIGTRVLTNTEAGFSGKGRVINANTIWLAAKRSVNQKLGWFRRNQHKVDEHCTDESGSGNCSMNMTVGGCSSGWRMDLKKSNNGSN